MKTVIFLLSFAALLLVTSVNAALVDNGDGTITDTDNNLMWLQDANYALTSGYDDDGMMTWNEALTWADTLFYGGYDDWMLPSALNPDNSGPCQEYSCTDSHMGHLYFMELENDSGGPLENTSYFMNLEGSYYWSRTEFAPDPANAAWYFLFGDSEQAYRNKANNSYALAVRMVPEPISTILFVTGGGILAGGRYIKKKRKA